MHITSLSFIDQVGGKLTQWVILSLTPLLGQVFFLCWFLELEYTITLITSFGYAYQFSFIHWTGGGQAVPAGYLALSPPPPPHTHTHPIAWSYIFISPHWRGGGQIVFGADPYIPHRRGGRHIVFCADLVCVGFGVGVACLKYPIPEPMDGFWPGLYCNFTRMAKTVVRVWWPWPYFQGHMPPKTVNFGPKMVCLHSISWTNQLILVKLNTINRYNIPQIWLDFGDFDLIFKGTGPQRLPNFVCLHSISWTNQLILVKLNTIYHYFILQIWLDFGDLDLIFKGTGPQKLSNFACLHSISWTNQLILVKLNTIYHYFILQIFWLDFGDLDLIFKVRCSQTLSILACLHLSHEWTDSVFRQVTASQWGIPEKLIFLSYQTVCSKIALVS